MPNIPLFVRRYGLAIVSVMAAFVLTGSIQALRDESYFLLFVGAVAVSAWYGGMMPGVLAGALSAVAANVLSLFPYNPFVLGVGDIVRICVFLFVAILVSFLQTRRKRAENQSAVLMEEFQAANLIQQELLPATPNMPEMDIAGFCRPASAVGGDFYDFVPMPDNRIAMVLGDVSGHGLGPGLVMAETRAYLRACALDRDDPKEILNAVNHLLYADLEIGVHFVTLFLAIIDTKEQTLRWSGAGHEAYLIDGEGRAVKLGSTGLPLGIQRNAEIEVSRTMAFEPGQLLLLFSDGIVETASSSGRMIGVKRVLECVNRHKQQKAQEIITKIWADTQRFRKNEPQHDDCTIVIAKFI